MGRAQLSFLWAAAFLLATTLPGYSAPTSYTAANLRSCNRAINPCCNLRYNRNSNVRRWTPPATRNVKVRRSLADVVKDPEYLEKYKLAYTRLRNQSLWATQTNLHCLFAGVYPNTMAVHSNYYFFPWHRLYLYFHERLLGKLIGDPNFALPFWSWDNADSQQVFDAFKDTSSSLYVRARNTNPTNLNNQIRRIVAAQSMMSITFDAADTLSFFGGVYNSFVGGAVESSVHNAIHGAVGTQFGQSVSDRPEGAEMGLLETAGNDPLFYVHHCNVDRMWWLWKRMNPALGSNRRPRSEPIDPDYLDATWVFVDENGELVEASARDATNLLNLEYTYDNINNGWISPGNFIGGTQTPTTPTPSPPPPARRPPPPSPKRSSPPPRRSPPPSPKRSPPPPPKKKKKKKKKKKTKRNSGRRLLTTVSDASSSLPSAFWYRTSQQPGRGEGLSSEGHARHLMRAKRGRSYPPTTSPEADPAMTPFPIPVGNPVAFRSYGTTTIPSLVHTNVNIGVQPTTVCMMQVQPEARPGFKACKGKRHKKKRGHKNEEILILQGFQLASPDPLIVNVFIDNVYANHDTPLDYAHGFVGYYAHCPSGFSRFPPKQNVQFPIYNHLAKTGKKSQQTFNVTFVASNPQTGRYALPQAVSVDHMYVVYR